MKKILFALTTSITLTAAGTSFYLSTLSNPTEGQKNLSNTANTIAITGTTALFSMLDDRDKDNEDNDRDTE